MARGGGRNDPGGKKSGPKLDMTELGIEKRMLRLAREARTAQRKAGAAAAAVEKEEADRRRAVLREESADQPMCLRRQHGTASADRRQEALKRRQRRRSCAGGDCDSAQAGHAVRLLLEAARAVGVILGSRHVQTRTVLVGPCVHVCAMYLYRIWFSRRAEDKSGEFVSRIHEHSQ